MDSAVTIIIMAGIAGGFIIGMVTGFFAGKKSRSPAELPQEDLIRQKETAREQIKSESVHEGYRPLFRLWRKNDGGALAFEIDETLYTERNALSKDAVRILAHTGREWLAWLGSTDKQETAHEDQSPAESTAAPGIQAATPVDVPSVALAAAVQAPAEHATSIESRKIEADPEHKVFRTDSIPNQIDAILQEKLAVLGLTQKRIHVTEDLNHEVVFMVGLNSYRSLDSIEDPEARQVIRLAISDWEKRTKPVNRR